MDEGKFREMYQDPLGVQVIIQDFDDKNVVYLVDHEGKF